MMTPEQAVCASILLCLAGAGLTLVMARYRMAAGWLAFAVTAGAAAMLFAAAARVLSGGPSAEPALICSLPQLGLSLRLHVDGLSAFFLILIGLISVPVALYSVAYLRHCEEYSVARYHPNLLLFLAAMIGLTSTTDMMWSFFGFWQLMTLSSWALIRFESRKPECIPAAGRYLVMMQLACAAVMAGAFLLSSSGSPAGLRFDSAAIGANLPLILASRAGACTIAFALFLTGFGIKMGMWPFGQAWVPSAYSAAPSPVSAMFSGVMTKTGVYGLLRCFLWLVPSAGLRGYPLGRWGGIIAVLGTITLFTGTMQALKQDRSKRLLAFSSIGQMGYILLGAGTCMALLPAGAPAARALASLAILCALLHVLNHGLFKALLFLNAGSMLRAAGTQDLNRMGGLIRFMPVTALTAFVASFSISGVPPFSGYISKWGITVAAVSGGTYARCLPVCAVIGVLTSGLTLATFIKFFGVSFLSRTSGLVAGRASSRGRLEVGWEMQAPQVFFALCCLAIGMLPSAAFRLLRSALEAGRGGCGPLLAGGASVAGVHAWGIEALGSSARFAPLAFAVFLGLLFAATRAIARLGNASSRASPPWLCGYAAEAECNRYAAVHFYGELKRYFGWLGGRPDVRPLPPAQGEP